MLRNSLISVFILSSLQVFAAKPMDDAITAMCDNLKKCTIEHLEMKQNHCLLMHSIISVMR